MKILNKIKNYLKYYTIKLQHFLGFKTITFEEYLNKENITIDTIEKEKEYEIKYKNFLLKNKKKNNRKLIYLTLIVSLYLVAIFYSLNNEKTYEEKIEKLPIVNIQNIVKNKDNINEIILNNINNSNKISTINIDYKKDKDIEYKVISTIDTKDIINKLENNDIKYKWQLKTIEKPFNFYEAFSTFLTILIVAFFGMFFYKMMKQQGMLGMDKSKFEIIYPNGKNNIDNLIGMKDIKDEIKQVAHIFQNNLEYQKFNIKNSMNLLLSGPAGTGKSRIVRTLCDNVDFEYNEETIKGLNCPIVFVSGSNLDDKYVGGSQEILKNMYKVAKKEGLKYAIQNNIEKPKCVVFIDEGQELVKDRNSHGNNSWKVDLQNTLLTILDNGSGDIDDIEIITVIASNFDDTSFPLDEAISRRLPLKINFRLPNKKERKDILKFYLNQISDLRKDKIDLDYLSDIFNGISPAIIENIVKKSGMLAVKNKSKINTELLFKSYEILTIGLTDRETTKNLSKVRKIIALHELGHFFTQFHLETAKVYGKDINIFDNNNNISLSDKLDILNKVEEESLFLKISTESISKMKQSTLGYVMSKQSENMFLKSVIEYEEEIISLYGGLASELVFLGKGNETLGSFNDIEKVSKILDYLYNNLNVYEKSYINNKLIEGFTPNNEKNIKEKSETLLNRSIEIVEIYKKEIEILSEILLEEYVLDKPKLFKEIKKLIKQN